MKKRSSPLDRFARDLSPGVLEWIGVRPERRSNLLELEQVVAIAGAGLEGDHRTKNANGSSRQVTIISREFIAQIMHFTGKKDLHPGLLRRNLVVSGINLNALRYQRFEIGDALFEAGALCHPCSRMETALGTGGVAAMIGHGGLCCKIIRSGNLALGDNVEVRPEGENMDLFKS
ncbi:MAG: MOSC domain-containing protein [Halioglobus sp.]|jgi:MOSC domain-containing protein YiiM